MRSWKAFYWLPLLCLLFFFCPSGLCEQSHDHLSVALSGNPDHMVLAQDATFTFRIQNDGDTDAYDVTILLPEANGQQVVGQIQPGETATAELSYPVTDADLDRGSITFALSHADVPGGEAFVNEDVTLALTRDAEAPSVEFTRQISSRYVHAGDALTVVYQLKNTGNVRLSGISLNDPLGDFSASLESLAVGASQTFINRVTVSQSTASAPTVMFASGASGQSYTKSLSSSSITLAEEAIFAQLSVSNTEVAYGDSVTLTLTLTNGGNVSFSGITLTDSALGVLENEPLSLPSGAAPVVIARSCVIKSDTTFQVHVTGNTDAGTPFSVDTDPVTVKVLERQGAANLSLSVEPSARTLSAPGMVSFTITLTNNGQTDLSRVTLREATRGEVRMFDVIPAGDPTVREQMYDVNEDCTFQFLAEMTDADGTVRIVSSDPIAITIGEGGQTPLATARSGFAALFQNGPLPIAGVSFFPVVVGVSVALLLLLILALVLSSRKKRRQRSANRAERMKRSERFGKTNKFTPVRRNPRAKDAPKRKKK